MFRPPHGAPIFGPTIILNFPASTSPGRAQYERADIEGGRKGATLALLDLQPAQDRFIQVDRDRTAAQSPAREIEKRGVALGRAGGGGVTRIEVRRPKSPHGIEELEKRNLTVFAVAGRERALIAPQVISALRKRAYPHHKGGGASDLVADLARQAVA